jgi:hypothetical protein
MFLLMPLPAHPFTTMSTITDITFPSELAEKVIDQIYWDEKAILYVDDWEQYSASCLYHRRSLCACSLVSKSWLPRSRYRLFESVNLDRGLTKKTLEFLALLESPLSTIAPYVRHLTLEEERGRNEYEARWLNAALPRLTVLSAIESLTVDGARFEVLGTEDTTGFFASFSSLKELHLSYCTFRSSMQVIGVLSANPDLEDVSLNVLNIQVKQNSDELPQEEEGGHIGATISDTDPLCFPPPSHLKALGIGSVDGKAEILKWLMSGTSMPPVELLQMNIVKEEDSRSVTDFLRALGPSLKDLELGLSSIYSRESQGVSFSLLPHRQ